LGVDDGFRVGLIAVIVVETVEEMIVDERGGEGVIVVVVELMVTEG